MFRAVGTSIGIPHHAHVAFHTSGLGSTHGMLRGQADRMNFVTHRTSDVSSSLLVELSIGTNVIPGVGVCEHYLTLLLSR